MKDFRLLFMIFITYSFIGWLIEMISVGTLQKKIVNRGFLIGPYCPIYGLGSVFITLLLDTDKNDLFGIFVKAVFICAVLEYLTSLIMEKLFRTRWWDYTDRKFNINGRICLETMIPFGIGGCILVYIVSPTMINVYNWFPPNVLTILSIILLIIFASDMVISLNIINSVKNTFNNSKKDSTEEITNKVRKVLVDSYLCSRLIKAFPNLKPKPRKNNP